MSPVTKISLSLHAACFALCVAAAAQAAGSEPTATAHPMKTAQYFDQRGLEFEARFYYGKVLMQEPRNTAALAAIGLLEVRIGEFEAAQVHLERLQRACGQCAEATQLAAALARRNPIGRADAARPQQ